MTRSGARILVDALEAHRVDVVFGVPGESYLAVLDALVDSPIRYVTCRQEVGASNMAEAAGKLTGRPGVCIVTRGPGATHASCGVHTASQDSTPMVLLVGQVPREMLGRDAFQEIDYAGVFGTMAKRVEQVDSADAMDGAVRRAFAAATEGRPGPVVLALPEDVLTEESAAATSAPSAAPPVAPSVAEMAQLRELIAAAERPLVIVGEGGWSAAVSRDVLVFAEASELPVAASFRCQDYVDNHSRVYCGHLTIGPDPSLARRVEEADVILAVGGRLGDVTTGGYRLLEVPEPRQTLIHVHPDAAEIGRVYRPTLGIAADLGEAAASLASLEPLEPRWTAWSESARAEYLDNLVHRPLPGKVDMGEVMAILRARLPADAILATGAGNFTIWAHRFYEFRSYPSQLSARSGAMGYGLPAAVAAKVIAPERTVVCITGDGDFLMSAQELATAVQHRAPIVVVLMDNGMYGTIRMHQERHYPGRTSGTDLVNPDFAALARAFGGFGERVVRTEDFGAALERAVASGLPALLHLVVDPEAISPRRTLTQIRDAAR